MLSSELAGSEDGVELFESVFSPNAESSDVSSGGKLEEVESGNVDGLNSGNVSQSFNERYVGTLVDDQRSSSGSVSSVSDFTSSGSDLLSVNDFLDISPSSDVLKESDGFLGSFNLFGGVVNDEWEFRDVINSVSSRLN